MASSKRMGEPRRKDSSTRWRKIVPNSDRPLRGWRKLATHQRDDSRRVLLETETFRICPIPMARQIPRQSNQVLSSWKKAAFCPSVSRSDSYREPKRRTEGGASRLRTQGLLAVRDREA